MHMNWKSDPTATVLKCIALALYEDSWVFVAYFPTREYRILNIQYRSN